MGHYWMASLTLLALSEPADDRHMGVTLLKHIANSQGDSLLDANGTPLMVIWQRGTAPAGRSNLFDQMLSARILENWRTARIEEATL